MNRMLDNPYQSPETNDQKKFDARPPDPRWLLLLKVALVLAAGIMFGVLIRLVIAAYHYFGPGERIAV